MFENLTKSQKIILFIILIIYSLVIVLMAQVGVILLFPKISLLTSFLMVYPLLLIFIWLYRNLF